jgi:hypothetical protein
VNIDKTETHRGIYPGSAATEHRQGQPVLKRKTAEAKYEYFLIGLDSEMIEGGYLCWAWLQYRHSNLVLPQFSIRFKRFG